MLFPDQGTAQKSALVEGRTRGEREETTGKAEETGKAVVTMRLGRRWMLMGSEGWKNFGCCDCRVQGRRAVECGEQLLRRLDLRAAAVVIDMRVAPG